MLVNFLMQVALFAYSVFAESTDCSSYEIDNFPVVRIYDASDEDYIYSNVSVQLKQPVGLKTFVAGWPGMECTHTKSVRWVLNLDYHEKGIGDTYSTTTRDADEFYDSSTYQFKAELELQIYQKNRNFVISCVAYENICERTSVEVTYEKDKEAYIIKTLSKSEENGTLLQELIGSVERNNKYWNNENYVSSKDTPNCSVTFLLIKENKNQVIFEFDPRGEYIAPRTIPERQTLENTYLSYEHLSPKCVRNTCKNCTRIFLAPETKYWPRVFLMTNNDDISRVVHSYHTLVTRDYRNGANTFRPPKGPGKLKLAWEHSDKRDFLDMEELPLVMYYNDEVEVTCKISPFMFAFGTKIAYELKQIEGKSTSKLAFLPDVEESTEIPETREAKGKLLFPFQSTNATDKNDTTITVYCFAPVANSSMEWVNVSSHAVTLYVPQLEVTRGSDKRKVFNVPLGASFNTTCIAGGLPRPKVFIELPRNSTTIGINESLKNSTVYKTIIIPKVDASHEGFYNCVSTNPRGLSFYTFEIKIAKSGEISSLSIILISVFGAISAIFLGIVVILLVRFRMEKEEFRRMTEEAVREFREGMDASTISSAEGGDGHAYANDTIKASPYESKYEVSHKLWTIENTLLGTGAFGMVRKGTVEIGSRKSVIAVKTVKSPDDIDNFRATLLELKIMAYVGHHRHVVKLIAASTEEIQNRKVFIGVEFCASGSLLEYLQKRKKLFNSMVKDGELILPSEKGKDEPENANDDLYENLIVTSDISTIDLYKWSYQIASGMDFLESKKVLHADLAARNILLTEELVVKISDFGLSRDLYENSEYTKKTQVALPWKWMAIESLKFLKFSTKSDVWSYGVTLYEVFTLGEEPYIGQSWTEDFVQMLENGMRLSQPEYGTKNLYTRLMMPCWCLEPSERISFSDGMSFFEKAIGLLTQSPRKDDECREFC